MTLRAVTAPAEDLRRRRPSQERSQSRLRAILDAAGELIVELGLDAVTTRAVAERAGVPIGSVYYLFPDKYAIYRELLTEANAKMQALTSGAAQLDPDHWRDWFDDGLRALGEFYDRERAFAALLRALRHLPGFHEIDVAGNRVYEDRIEEALKRLLPRLPRARRVRIARTCVAIGDRLLQESLEVDDHDERAEIVAEARRAVIAYLETYAPAGNAESRKPGRERR